MLATKYYWDAQQLHKSSEHGPYIRILEIC